MGTNRYYSPSLQFFKRKAPGVLASGTVEFVRAGTLERLDTYEDENRTVVNPNPIVLDGDGISPVKIYLQALEYDIYIRDKNGATDRVEEGVFFPESPLDFSGIGGGAPSYTAGFGITLNGFEIQADTQDVANRDSPVFLGNPTGPTPAAADNSASLATTEFVQTELNDYAPLVDPVFTGTFVTAPTPPTNAVGNEVVTAQWVVNRVFPIEDTLNIAINAANAAAQSAADADVYAGQAEAARDDALPVINDLALGANSLIKIVADDLLLGALSVISQAPDKAALAAEYADKDEDVPVSGVSPTTFDPASAVDTGTDVITIAGHGFSDGQQLAYGDGGGTAIGGLTDGQTVFVRDRTTNSFKLAATRGGAALDLTSQGGGSAHTLASVYSSKHHDLKARASADDALTSEAGAFIALAGVQERFLPGTYANVGAAIAAGGGVNTIYINSSDNSARRILSVSPASEGILDQTTAAHVAILNTLDGGALPSGVIASQAQAEAGTDNAKSMTPLSVAQSVFYRKKWDTIRLSRHLTLDGATDQRAAFNALASAAHTRPKEFIFDGPLALDLSAGAISRGGPQIWTHESEDYSHGLVLLGVVTSGDLLSVKGNHALELDDGFLVDASAVPATNRTVLPNGASVFGVGARHIFRGRMIGVLNASLTPSTGTGMSLAKAISGQAFDLMSFENFIADDWWRLYFSENADTAKRGLFRFERGRIANIGRSCFVVNAPGSQGAGNQNTIVSFRELDINDYGMDDDAEVALGASSCRRVVFEGVDVRGRGSVAFSLEEIDDAYLDVTARVDHSYHPSKTNAVIHIKANLFASVGDDVYRSNSGVHIASARLKQVGDLTGVANSFGIQLSGVTQTFTFDPQTAGVVDTAGDYFDFANSLENGNLVRYQNGGGTSIAPLTSNSNYYVVEKGVGGANRFKLATSKGGSPINLTSTGAGTSHNVARLVPAAESDALKIDSYSIDGFEQGIYDNSLNNEQAPVSMVGGTIKKGSATGAGVYGARFDEIVTLRNAGAFEDLDIGLYLTVGGVAENAVFKNVANPLFVNNGQGILVDPTFLFGPVLLPASGYAMLHLINGVSGYDATITAKMYSTSVNAPQRRFSAYFAGEEPDINLISSVAGPGIVPTLRATKELTAAAVNAGGTGYAVDDVLTIAGGSLWTGGAAASVRVTAVSSGVITAVEVVHSGEYSADPTTTANSVSGGSGSGATLDLTMKHGLVMSVFNSGSAIVDDVQVLVSGQIEKAA